MLTTFAQVNFIYMKNLSQKHTISALIILIFAAVIVNYLIFAFTDNRLTFLFDADYAHKTHNLYKFFIKIIDKELPLKTIFYLPHTILTEKYIAAAFLFLPKTLETFRLLHLTPLIFTLLAVVFLSRKMQNNYTALVSLLLTASSPGIIAFSKQVWSHFYMSLFLLWGIFFIAKSKFGNKLNYMLLATVFLLLSQNTHYSAIFYASIILTALIITASERIIFLLFFWIILNAFNVLLPFTIAKITILLSTAFTCLYLYKNSHAKNICLSLGIFSLIATISPLAIFSNSAVNTSNILFFNESFYFISFFKPIFLLVFISAFYYIFTSYKKNPLIIIIASVFLPESIMFFAQISGINPAPRGLNTYITLFLLSFILSSSFFTKHNKKITFATVFTVITLFIVTNYYLPNRATNLKAKKTIPLFFKNDKYYGKEELKSFLNSIPKNTSVGVLTPYASEAIYQGEISFVEETALWILAPKNIDIVPIVNPTKYFSGQLILMRNDYFIFEKNQAPHNIILQTETLLNKMPLFYLYKKIQCTGKEILIYKKENISTAVSNQAIKFISQKFLSSPS